MARMPGFAPAFMGMTMAPPRFWNRSGPSAASGRPTVMVCFGTRPEAIKLAPVVERLERGGRLGIVRVATAQHREMLDQTLASVGLEPDVDLALMRPDQELTELAGSAISALGEVISDV